MKNLIPVFSHPMIKKLDLELDGIFKNAPHLPKKVTEVLVKIAPYLTLVSGLFLITGGLRSLFGANDFYRVFNFWKGISPVYFYVVGLLQILTGIISLIAYQPLKNKEIAGWYILFCLSLLQLVMNLISVFFFRGGLFGLLFGLLISLYILYELKSEYSPIKNVVKVIKKKK